MSTNAAAGFGRSPAFLSLAIARSPETRVLSGDASQRTTNRAGLMPFVTLERRQRV